MPSHSITGNLLRSQEPGGLRGATSRPSEGLRIPVVSLGGFRDSRNQRRTGKVPNSNQTSWKAVLAKTNLLCFFKYKIFQRKQDNIPILGLRKDWMSSPWSLTSNKKGTFWWENQRNKISLVLLCFISLYIMAKGMF